MSQGVVVLVGNWQRGSCPMGVIVLWGSCLQDSCPRGSCPRTQPLMRVEEIDPSRI